MKRMKRILNEPNEMNEPKTKLKRNKNETKTNKNE
jgi:hypothetical protein